MENRLSGMLGIKRLRLTGGRKIVAAIAAAFLAIALVIGPTPLPDKLGFYQYLAIVMILLSALLGLLVLRASEREHLRAQWDESLRDFRTYLTIVTAHLRSAMQTGGQSILPFGEGWDSVAPKARWPLNDSQSLRGWATRNNNWMNPDELNTLRVARWVGEDVERNTVVFQSARSRLSGALEQWMEWDQESAIAPEIRASVTGYRDAIVMLAYLEIAHAESVHTAFPWPKWGAANQLWPVLGIPTVAPSVPGV
jgi:hypothetical protein